MARVWVLDTDTKGTGATMVPLESILSRPAAGAEPSFMPPPAAPEPPRPQPPPRAQGRPPRRFRVLDVRSRELLAEDAPAREALAALAGVRSIVDVTVYVWEQERRRWRLLSFDEQRLLWRRRPAPR